MFHITYIIIAAAFADKSYYSVIIASVTKPKSHQVCVDCGAVMFIWKVCPWWARQVATGAAYKAALLGGGALT